MHATALSALAHLVTALLVGQSLRPTALMRALSSPLPVPARQRYKRVARAWTRPWRSPAWLVPAALALVPAERDGVTHLALDSVRCGGWEVFTLGVVWHGRVLPVGWAVLPYPWPKGRFTPTVCALIRQVAAVWPAERPVHLVADRGFPSRLFLLTLRQVRWGWTVRLRATHGVTVAGQVQPVRTLLTVASPDCWTAQPAHSGHGPHALPGTLVSVAERLTDAPRCGAPARFTPEQVCQIIALACERPADSHRPISQWSHRELADEIVRRGIVEWISPRHAGRLLNRGRPKSAPDQVRV